jgi:hypothetical protein
MIRYLAYEGPNATLFLIEAGRLRAITDDGGEVLLPFLDLVELLLHLSLHRVQIFQVLNEQLGRLAVVLQEHC